MNNEQRKAAADLAYITDMHESGYAAFALVLKAQDALFALCAPLIAAADMPQGWERSVVRRRKIAAVLLRNAL